jgi:putative hydrolase of the HAD superfamily
MSSRRPPAAVVIDLFHTLIDPEDFRPKEFRRVDLICELLKLDTQTFADYWSGETSQSRQTRAIPISEFLAEYLTSQGKHGDPDALKRIEEEFGRYQDMAILNPRPHVIPALKRLREMGLTLALLSNTTHREVQAWSKSRLAPLFDAAVFSSEIGYKKPDAAAYRAALEKIGGVRPGNAAYIGDGRESSAPGKQVLARLFS